ncbi:hypothetical protein tpqmel_0051 [Candidatus Gastranaerophilus sp. (ex Termes propinquus)]|nr:hypothetical protein tpqmel_0051 [Candidatus Gastranaerophilus sp. (ex Termes propinquus)]
MKKILLTLCAMLSCSCVFAYIDESTTADIEKLRRDNYSESMLKIVDRARFHAENGDANYYDHFYTQKYKFGYLGYWYNQAKAYIDPVAEDNNFGRYEIDFSNRAFQFDGRTKRDRPDGKWYGKQLKGTLDHL